MKQQHETRLNVDHQTQQYLCHSDTNSWSSDNFVHCTFSDVPLSKTSLVTDKLTSAQTLALNDNIKNSKL